MSAVNGVLKKYGKKTIVLVVYVRAVILITHRPIRFIRPFFSGLSKSKDNDYEYFDEKNALVIWFVAGELVHVGKRGGANQ